MKRFSIAMLLGASAILIGCNQGTSGGPGATSPPFKKPMLGQAANTFSLAVPSMNLNQGETKTVTLGVNRGENFNEDVSLKLGDLPKGVTSDPARPVINHGDTDMELTLKAANDAALGNFTVKVTGHPTKGADAVAELKISVAKQEAGSAAKAQWDEYIIAMQKQLDQLTAKYAELKERAAKAEGQAKTDLDAKLAEAKTKLDAAALKLEEMKSAGADRWEKVKEGVANAFDDLKRIFE